MSDVYRIADEYVDRYAALHPIAATMIGVPGYDTELTDFSPDASAEMDALDRETLAALDAAPERGERDRVAKEAMAESLATNAELFDAGEHLRDLSILGSPLQYIRMAFDLMPAESEEHWANISSRMGKVPRALASYRAALEEGLRKGKAAARTQATEAAEQARVWGGRKEGQPSFFAGLLDRFDSSGVSSAGLRGELEASAMTAAAAYGDFGDFLAGGYVKGAAENDAVGADRYQTFARVYNGTVLDLLETYEWGWEQLRWVEDEMRSAADKILPGGTVEAAKELLETDPERSIEGEEAFRQWMQDTQDRTIEELDGTHFDIPEPVKDIEAMIAPPGSAAAMYYTPPSEDFSRPGRTWYPTGGKTRFPVWGEVSIAYHEGVPGHHFQNGVAMYLSKDLSRHQRLLGRSSGHGEGWALYAERLMAELGYLQNPDYYLGMLRAQALRSVRVIIDIGMHLELAIPGGQDFHPSETWTPELGLEFIVQRSHFPEQMVTSEITRYLGMPAQAISYKVGERAWLEARKEAETRKGPSFDLKEFHNRALNLGPMGLDQLKRELAKV